MKSKAQLHRKPTKPTQRRVSSVAPRQLSLTGMDQEAGLHALHHSLGNQQVQRLLHPGRRTSGLSPKLRHVIQRALTARERAEDLKSSRFAGDERLEAAFDNRPPMRRGARGDAVAKIQQALIDDGYQMPVSTRKTGAPDGIYGRETGDTVKQFQVAYKLKDDGVVGRHTLGKLDELYAGPIPTKIPPKAQPEIEASESEIGKHIVDDMDKANDPRRSSPTSGVWYSHNYKAMHNKYPAHYPWDPDYGSGYANPAYFMRIGWMDWLLNPGVSASAGIRAWLKGLTIAECNSALVAIYINALRASIGDQKFDDNFGSAEKPIPPQQRLRVKQGRKETPLEKTVKKTEAATKEEAGTFGNRPAKVGGWYYFYNHPKYLLKHPAGAFQGENAIYAGRSRAGEQLWSGLGVSNVAEKDMLKEMANAYNSSRSEDDHERLVRWYVPRAPELRQPDPNYPALYLKYIDRIEDKYRHDKGHWPDEVDKTKILQAPEYELDGVKRKGGYVGQSGYVLDVEKVKALRNG